MNSLPADPFAKRDDYDCADKRCPNPFYRMNKRFDTQRESQQVLLPCADKNGLAVNRFMRGHKKELIHHPPRGMGATGAGGAMRQCAAFRAKAEGPVPGKA